MKQDIYSQIQSLHSKCDLQVFELKKIKLELESLRFTMALWSYMNVGLIITLVYVSWSSYKRQKKISEWIL